MSTEVTFPYEEHPFAACRKAEDWARDWGCSIGSMERDEPIGLKFGEYNIAKWNNLTSENKAQLDGRMLSDNFRHGPITVILDAKDLQPYTVTLLYPDYATDEYGETYMTHVHASAPIEAADTARVEAGREVQVDNPNDFAVVSIVAGHHEDLLR